MTMNAMQRAIVNVIFASKHNCNLIPNTLHAPSPNLTGSFLLERHFAVFVLFLPRVDINVHVGNVLVVSMAIFVQI
jgi:hypothetical protein